jgi:hypothetical protein
VREVTRPLALARIALGTVFLVRTTPLVNALPFPLAAVRGPLFGWPDGGWPFAWDGLALPDGVRVAACVVRTLAAVLFVLGVRARAAGLVAGACGVVALSQDPFGFVFTLHTLFLGTMVLALTDATSDLALAPDRPLGAASGARLAHIFVASIYAWSALAKAQSEWLSGATLRALAEDGLLSTPATTLLVAHPALAAIGAWSVFVAEAALPVLLLAPRTRRGAVALACILHISFELGARPDVMGLVMASLLVTFLGPAPHPPPARPSRDRARPAEPSAARTPGSATPRESAAPAA